MEILKRKEIWLCFFFVRGKNKIILFWVSYVVSSSFFFFFFLSSFLNNLADYIVFLLRSTCPRYVYCTRAIEQARMHEISEQAKPPTVWSLDYHCNYISIKKHFNANANEVLTGHLSDPCWPAWSLKWALRIAPAGGWLQRSPGCRPTHPSPWACSVAPGPNNKSALCHDTILSIIVHASI